MAVTIFTLITALLGLLPLLSRASTFTNPIRNPGGSDPFLVYTGDYYYLLTTTWTDVEITRASTIEGLKTGDKKVVYSTTEASRCCNVWSPEVHYLGGIWYIYYTAGESADLDGQRLHVLTGGSTPWDDFTYTAQLTTDWAIDGSVLRFNDYGIWLMFSCFHDETYQSICIQQLSDDYVSLTGDIYVISTPTESWEKEGYPVNEAPAALYLEGNTYISYSASDCWTQYYCLGLLTWDGTTNPSEASAWTKSDGCRLSSANGNYGPGSNGFFVSPDETETWIVFHATEYSSGACNDSRYTMVQPVSYSNGAPSFGVPEPFTYVFNEPS